MIYLDPPYHVINSYTVLSDHADPNLFYVLPPAPMLSQEPDGRPVFSLIQYQGGGVGAQKVEGGLLSLTTELHVPEEALLMLREPLSERVDRPAGALQLLPVLFDSGTVELIALGATSGAAPATPATPAASPFQVTFLGSGKPSLGGRNSASFQLVLDALAAALVEGALEAPDLPLIAIYRLTFAGLRPSFRINIQADWSKVYRSLQNKAEANVYIAAAKAEALVTETLEENNIEIDTQVFGTGEGAQAAAERARKQLIDWVLERLFQPMADPTAATANAIGQVVDDTIWSLARTVLPGVSYRLRLLEDEQVRIMSARMDEAVAERREIIPQGTLGGLLNRYRVDETGKVKANWPDFRAQLVQKIPLNSFPRLEVQVAAEDRFASDGLAEVRVELGRLGASNNLIDRKTLAFRSATERENYIVNLLGQRVTDFSTPYQYRLEVQFNPAGPFGPHAPVTSDWQTGNTTELFVEPRSTYLVREVEVGLAPIFSFTQFPAVTVELRYTGDEDATLQTSRIRLTEDQPSQLWRFRSFAGRLQPYEYRVTYHRAGPGGDIEVPWQPQIDEWLPISDPLPDKRLLNIFVSLPWEDIEIAFVQIRYQDEANGIQFDEQIDLNSTMRFITRNYPVAANGVRAIGYRLTLLFKSFELLEGSWRETEDDRLVIDRRLVDRRLITVRPIGGSLIDNRLSEVRIQLRVQDPQTNQVRAETEMRLAGDLTGQPIASWEYLLGDPPVRTVEYSAWFADNNGFVTRIPWTSTKADMLVVHLKTKTIIG